MWSASFFLYYSTPAEKKKPFFLFFCRIAKGKKFQTKTRFGICYKSRGRIPAGNRKYQKNRFFLDMKTDNMV
jgi:hypothetical protein